MAPSLSELAVAAVIAAVLSGADAVRELRPSDHGLVFQTSSPRNSTLEMRSFFNTKGSSTDSDMSLPKATNSTASLPPAWWSPAGDGGGGRRLGGALMVASLVCGVAGVVLLVVSGLVYVFRHRRRRRREARNESFRGGGVDNDANANKLQLVAAPAVRNY